MRKETCMYIKEHYITQTLLLCFTNLKQPLLSDIKKTTCLHFDIKTNNFSADQNNKRIALEKTNVGKGKLNY